MIDGRNFFDQPRNNIIKTYEKIRKIATGQGDDYTTGCLLDYSHFKENYKMIAIDLSKQQTFHADPRAIQQIDFTANLDRAGNATMFFIIEEAKETVFDVKLSNSQLNRLKSAIKNETEIVLRLSSDMIGNSNDETNFPRKVY